MFCKYLQKKMKDRNDSDIENMMVNDVMVAGISWEKNIIAL